MSKSILVIETPESYENCPCFYPSYKSDFLHDCALTGETAPATDENGNHKKPDFCPLRNLPNKKPVIGIDGASSMTEIRKHHEEKGFNDCLDIILKNETRIIL